MPDLRLPPGFTARPVVSADIPALHDLVAAYERAVFGYAERDADEITAILARPGLDPLYDTVLVSAPDGATAAWAWVNRRSEAIVHPSHRGLGIGSALLDWIGSRASPVAQTVPDADTAAAALLRSHGWEPFVTSWQLEIAMDSAPSVPAPPPGVTIRPYATEDAHAAYTVLEDAFDEWQQRRKSYEEWSRLTVAREAFAPAQSFVAVADGALVAVLLSLTLPGVADGYVERLAVRADHRGRGIARLLLRSAFAAFYAAGRRSCTVWTHSDTGALAVYEHAGMGVRRSSTVYRR